MENLVFIELVRRGFVPNVTLFYQKNRDNTEVDFVTISKDKKLRLIQVSYDISESKTKERELKALSKSAKELNCSELSVVNWSFSGEEEYQGCKIKCISLLEWLRGVNEK